MLSFNHAISWINNLPQAAIKQKSDRSISVGEDKLSYYSTSCGACCFVHWLTQTHTQSGVCGGGPGSWERRGETPCDPACSWLSYWRWGDNKDGRAESTGGQLPLCGSSSVVDTHLTLFLPESVCCIHNMLKTQTQRWKVTIKTLSSLCVCFFFIFLLFLGRRAVRKGDKS